MNWIQRKADKYLNAKMEREIRDKTIAQDYWLLLRQQIERDVAEINANPAWKEQVTNNPIKVTDTAGGYKITKDEAPKVEIVLIDRKPDIDFTFTIYRVEDLPPPPIPPPAPSPPVVSNETWSTAGSGRHIVLSRMGEEHIIPGDASEHILKPVLDSIIASIEI